MAPDEREAFFRDTMKRQPAVPGQQQSRMLDDALAMVPTPSRKPQDDHFWRVYLPARAAHSRAGVGWRAACREQDSFE